LDEYLKFNQTSVRSQLAHEHGWWKSGWRLKRLRHVELDVCLG